jgi:Sodium/hydrogen exchanger family
MIFAEPIINSISWVNSLALALQPPLLATTNEAENAPIVLTGVLLSLVVIYLASKIGGEFITVGAKVDLGVLNPVNPENREGLIIATFLIMVAIIGKVVTGWAIFGQPGINRLAVGVGMIPRGEVGLVFAAIGAASGTLAPS